MSGLVLDFDGDDFARDADVLAKSTLPRAARQALASIRPAVVEGMREVLVEHLDNPTPFTLEGIDAGLGTSSSPEMTVFVQPRQAEYLKYALEGGSRSDVVIPAKDAPVDRQGNLPRGYLRASGL